MTILVAGLGAAGSAALYHLAVQGAEVVGIDPWLPPHTRGSTHGASRIHRQAYMEGPVYLPLLRRADRLWVELEAASGRSLLLRTGGLMVGPPDGPLLAGSLRSAREGGVEVEELSRSAVQARFPELSLSPGHQGVLEPGAGVLDPEAVVEAHLDGARKAGARILTGEGLLGWDEEEGAVQVRTSRGTHRVDQLVLAVGPWAPRLLASRAAGGADPLFPPRCVERQVTGHFRFRDGAPRPGVPVIMLDRGDEPLLYVIPESGGQLLKAGLHHGGDRADHPSGLRKEVLQDDEVRIAAPLGALIPGIESRWVEGSVCLYTNAPEERWRIGHLPGSQRVVVLSACSGHGFKVSSAVGEAAAALALHREPPVSLGPFSLEAPA